MEQPGLDARGNLTSLGKLRLVALTMARRWTRARGAKPSTSTFPCPKLPTGSLARKALEWSADASPPWLHAHVLRTYAWAQLLGEAAGLQPDDELLFVASMLHDLGLTERYPPLPDECFAFAGARHAQKLLESEGVPGAWAAKVANAVALHLEVRVALKQGVEAKLLADGAGLDVLGLGRHALAPATKRAVLSNYSREGFGPKVAERLRAAAKTAPGSRMAFYCQRVDFAGRAARFRLAEEEG